MSAARRLPRRPEGVDLIELAGAAEPTESVEELLSRRELGRAVAKAMAMLPEEQRTAIVLKEYHGLTFQEIADLLDCPLSTVKTRLYQGCPCCENSWSSREYFGESAPPRPTRGGPSHA